MKESLAARQAALLKQNAELNERVEAIEQRRQQQLTVSSSASALSQSAAGFRPSAGDHDEEDESTEETSDDVFQSDLEASSGYAGGAKRANRAPPQVSLTMDLSASIDSKALAEDEDAPHESGQQPDKRDSLKAKEEQHAQNSKGRQRMKRQGSADEAKFAKAAEDASSHNNNNNHRATLAHRGDESPEGLSLEATVRYQKARLRVLQDEADSASSHAKELVSLCVDEGGTIYTNPLIRELLTNLTANDAVCL